MVLEAQTLCVICGTPYMHKTYIYEDKFMPLAEQQELQ